ncbi:MAG: AAA family ATPase, partial [Candidatus Odinarchaeota archaeon]
MVYIKEIVMIGFKSFGNRTIRMPLEPGFNVIVGPNGSGKTNAIDAINFSLGSLSSKSMRTGKLTDLLYMGNKSSQPAEKAVVEIILDNSDYQIPIKEKTIIVSRELRKNGQGVYRLNGSRTTRGDILDKLRIAGIDCVDGYNIIQQGQVAEIIGMSADDRRTLLERVAGVGPFDAKKDAALAELDDAQKKMGELNLLVSEVSKRLEVLTKEKAVAEQWLEFDNEAKILKSLLVSFKLYKAKNDVNMFNQDIDKILEQIKQFENQDKRTIDEKVQKTEEMIKRLESAIKQTTIELEGKTKGINDLLIEETRIKQNLSFNDKIIIEKEADISRMLKQIDDNQRKKEEEEKTADMVEDEMKNISRNISTLTNLNNDLENQISDRKADYEEILGQYEDIELRLRRNQDKLTKSTIQVDLGKGIVDGLQKNVEKKNQQVEELENHIKQETGKIRLLKLEVDQGTKALEEAKRQLEASETIYNDYSDLLDEEKAMMKSIDDSILVLSTKLEMIKSLISREEGAENPAVTGIIQMAAKNEIKGVIGQLKAVQDETIPAEISHLAEAIVTVDTAAVVDCLKILKERALGTAFFIPLDYLGMNLDQKNKLPDKIRETSNFASTLEEAVVVWKEKRDQVIVTKDGDTFLPNGVVAGGFHMETARESIESLGREQIKKSQELEVCKTTTGNLKNKQNRVSKLNTILVDNIKNIEDRIRKSIVNLQLAEGNIKQYNTLLMNANEERTSLVNQVQQRLIAVEMEERSISELKHKIELLTYHFEKVKVSLEEADVTPLADKLREVGYQLIEQKNELIKSRMSLEIVKNKIESLENHSQEISEQIELETLKISKSSGSSVENKNLLETIFNKRDEIKENCELLQKRIIDEER